MIVYVAKIDLDGLFAGRTFVLMSDLRYVTKQGDSPSVYDCYSRLETPTLEYGGALPLFGSLEKKKLITQLRLFNRDGKLTNLFATRDIKGKAIALYAGSSDQSFSTFSLVADLVCDDFTVGDDVVIDVSVNGDVRLEKPITQNYPDASLPAGFSENAGRRRAVLGAMLWAPTDIVHKTDFTAPDPNRVYYSFADDVPAQLPTVVATSDPNALTAPNAAGAPYFGYWLPISTQAERLVGIEMVGSRIPGVGARMTNRVDHLIIEICRRVGIPESEISTADLNALYTAYAGQIGVRAKDELASALLANVMASCNATYYWSSGQLRFWWPSKAHGAPAFTVTDRNVIDVEADEYPNATTWRSKWSFNEPVGLPDSAQSSQDQYDQSLVGVLPRYHEVGELEPLKTAWKDGNEATAAHVAAVLIMQVRRRIKRITVWSKSLIPAYSTIRINAGVVGETVQSDWTAFYVKSEGNRFTLHLYR